MNEFIDKPQTQPQAENNRAISDLDWIVSQLKSEKIDDTTRMELAHGAAEIMYPRRDQKESPKIESDFALAQLAQIIKSDDPKFLRSMIAPIARSTLGGEQAACRRDEAGLLLDLINKKTSGYIN